VKFFLEDFTPEPEQCRFLILKVLEQSVRDYCSFANSIILSEQTTWELARDFLFDDDYRFMWGDLEISTEEFLAFVDLDIKWVRQQTLKRFKRGR
jgi:hypothetical protein